MTDAMPDATSPATPDAGSAAGPDATSPATPDAGSAGRADRLGRWRSALGRDGGRPAIAVAMACLTFLAAALATLQADASTTAARHERTADAWALERTGFDAGSVVGGLRDTNVFRQWFAVLEEAEWARIAAAEAPPDGTAGDTAYHEALARIDADLSEWLRERSGLLQPPYFDAATYRVDFNGFYGERAADGFRAAEHTRVENAAADAIGSKAAAYVTALTVVAVALFFLGLAGTVASGARRVLVTAGLGLAAIAVGWTGMVALRPVETVSDRSIEAVVRSFVAVQRAGSGKATLLTADAITAYRAAIDDAAEARDAHPAYVSAHRAHGEASLFFANARIFSIEGLTPGTRELLETGIASFERAIELDPVDPGLWWNLGFARYLAGDPAGAIVATAEVIERSPSEFVPYVNRAIAELGLGRRDLARASVDEAIEVARRSNLDTTGFFFARIDANLARLAVLRPEEADDLRGLQRRLREARVAIRALDGDLPRPDAPVIEAVEGEGLRLRPDGTFEVIGPIADGATVAQADLAGLRLRIAGGSDLAGRRVSVRAWLDDRADPGYDRDVTADGAEVAIDLVDPYGRAGFHLGTGRWVVEVFVDGVTRGSLAFEVGIGG